MSFVSRSWLSLLRVATIDARALAQCERAGMDGDEKEREADIFGEEPVAEKTVSEAPESERAAKEREADMCGYAWCATCLFS